MVLVHLHVHDAFHVHVHASCPCCTSMFLSMFSLVRVFVCMFVCVFVCMFVCVFMCVFVCVFVFVCINAGMPDCPASDQSGTGLKKLTMPGIVQYRTKPRQSGIFLARYPTEIIDAGMLMPALVSSMPMPIYGYATQRYVP
jgi:hypothetical protein